MKRLALILLCMVALVWSFVSCCWECQGMSEDALPWFIPVDYIGQTVLFTNGEDTVAVTYNSPEISHAMDKTFATVRKCSTTVLQYGVGEAWRMEYDITQYYLKGKEESGSYDFLVKIYFADQGYTRLLTAVTPTLVTTGTQFNRYDIYFDTWVSAGGETYQKVIKSWETCTSERGCYVDTVYCAAGKGLVQADLILGEMGTWYLIPPETEAENVSEH